MTTSYKDFKSSDLTFSEWVDSEKMKIKGQQKMCFPRYGQEEGTLFLQLLDENFSLWRTFYR